MERHPLLSPEERRRIVARAERMRAEAIASLFRATGRGIVRLFGAAAGAVRRVGGGPTKPSAARA